MSSDNDTIFCYQKPMSAGWQNINIRLDGQLKLKARVYLFIVSPNSQYIVFQLYIDLIWDLIIVHVLI